eukprot:COSAG01_NODE_60_length_29981_cov_23.262533_35_plen_94_part_00
MARCGGSAGEVDPWCEVGAWEVWAKRMPNGGQAVLVINRSDGPVSVTLALQELGLGATARARDVWGRRDLGTVRGTWEVGELASHDSALVRFS